MEPAKAYFDAIVKQSLLRFHQVKRGKWREVEALLYGETAFVAYQSKGMHFRLGPKFATTEAWLIDRANLQEAQAIENDWFWVPYPLKDIWAPLTDAALWHVKKIEI
ncbi:MAG: hypothetical protein AAF927_23015 [Bacteroidota bacterium]